jgi:hypothetical protein
VFLAIEDPSSAGGKLISSIPVEYAWRDEFRYFYSGVAYWGELATSQMPTGTEFLKGEYVWASLHTDKELESAACAWIESFGVHATIVSPTTLDQLLRAGHERLIVSAPWRKKLKPLVGPPTLGDDRQTGTPRSIGERAER